MQLIHLPAPFKNKHHGTFPAGKTKKEFPVLKIVGKTVINI